MPTNNFKLFDENKANLITDTEYANSTQRLNGVQTGVASSQLNNKFAYQVSLVAYAIAQIMNQNNLDASDTLAVSAFVGNLGAALLQKVTDKASSVEAAAGVLDNKYITPATMKAAALLLSGGTLTGNLDMNGNKILNLPTPSSTSEPATKGYVDGFDDRGWVKIASYNGKINRTTKQYYIDFTNPNKPVKQMKIIGTISRLHSASSSYGIVTVCGVPIAYCARDKDYNKTVNINTVANVYSFISYDSNVSSSAIYFYTTSLQRDGNTIDNLFSNYLTIYMDMYYEATLNVDFFFKY